MRENVINDILAQKIIVIIRAPLNHIRMLAVGGVKREEFASYEATGICGFGIGSGIVSKDLIAAGDYDGIRQKAEAYVNALK